MGGGQPIKNSKVRTSVDVRRKRAEAMYDIDKKSTIRKSQDNPILKSIYEDYIGNAGGEMAHKLLHTHYDKKQKYDI